ncbi:MAG: hypothetical protein IT369_24375 [Candidatus Latescibacteria bacterium]|nr:hypothetical protein [Candidatus Latescibacterota bacterium]
MAQYPVLFLRYIDVESTQAMVEYLASGGFAVVNPGQLNLLYKGLQERAEKRVQRVTVDLGHPPFHCWFDITRYWDANQYCPAITPLSGLELDGRLVALCSPPFISQYPCSSNQLYINVLVFGLIQPSQMGGRYRSAY